MAGERDDRTEQLPNLFRPFGRWVLDQIEMAFRQRRIGTRYVPGDTVRGPVEPAAHALVGAKHTAAGLTIGNVLTATGATTFAFQAPAALGNHDHSGDAGDGGTFDAANLTSGAAGDGQVLTADGLGGAAWEAPTGGAVDAADVTYTPAVLADWDGDADPGDADNALDQLAERVDDLENVAPGADANAIHVNAASEIQGIAEKASPADDDVLVLEDSADSWNKKRTPVSAVKSGSGAPTTAKYVTTATDAGLSAEVAIPRLAGSADIAGAGGGGITEEYDTATTGLTWTSAPDTVDSNTTVKSHLYVTKAFGAAAASIGTRAWAPGAGAFDVRAHISALGTTLEGYTAAGLYVANSDDSLAMLVNIWRQGNGWSISAFTYASATWTQRGSAQYQQDVQYVRITRDGSNNVSFYFGRDGLHWELTVTYSFTLTVAKLGYRFGGNNSTTSFVADWLRSNV